MDEMLRYPAWQIERTTIQDTNEEHFILSFTKAGKRQGILLSPDQLVDLSTDIGTAAKAISGAHRLQRP
jgi:hypothetical protein